MTQEQLDKAAKLKTQLDYVNKVIKSMERVKSGSFFCTSPKITISTNSLTDGSITFCKDFSKMIADYILVLMEDDKQAIERKIKNL